MQKKVSSMVLAPQVIEKAATEAEENLEALVPLPRTLNELKMTSDEDYEVLMDEARKAREAQRNILEKQKPLLELCDQMKRKVKDLFKPLLNVCEEVLEIADNKRLQYDRHLVEVQRAEQERLDKEAKKEQQRLDRNAKRRAAKAESEAEKREIIRAVPEIEAVEAEEVAPARIAGVSVAKIWDYEILDEYKVPEFDVDMDLVLWTRKFNRSGLLKARECHTLVDDDPQPVLGVRFFQKDSTRYGRL